MFKLRFYQEEGSRACFDILMSDKKTCKELVVAPTAAGKSLYIADTVSRIDEPILVLQPSKELLSQNYDKFKKMGGVATICCSSLGVKTINKVAFADIDGEFVPCREVSKVTYATVGTVKTHLKELKKMGVTRAIIDEAHLMTKAGSQIRKLFKDLGITHVVGLTATPVYLEGSMGGSSLKMMNRARWKMFSSIRYVTQISSLVKSGFWSKLIYQVNDTDESYLQQNTTGSDFTVQSLQKFYTANNLKEQIVEEVKNLTRQKRKSILVFVPTIAEADALYAMVPNSAVVHSKMDSKTRDYVVKAFKDLTIPVVFNVNVLSVGFDHPELDAIITARPTSSIAIFYQQIGRGVRIHPEKDSCKVVDFSGNVKKFGRIEGLHFEDLEGYGWGMFNEKNELLTDYPIGNFTRPTKDSLMAKYKDIPSFSEALAGKKDVDNTPVMWFGKHKNKTLKTVVEEDKGYAAWIYDMFDFKTPKMKVIKKHLEVLLELPRTR